MKEILLKISGLKRIYKQLIIILNDIIIAFLTTWVAYTVRIGRVHIPSDIEIIPYTLVIILFLTFFFLFKIYTIILRFGGIFAARSIFFACASYSLLFFLILDFLSLYNVPRSIAIYQPILFSVTLIINRFSIILIINYLKSSKEKNNIMIYGSGEAAYRSALTLSSFHTNNIIGFIDDKKINKGKKILGYKIYYKDQIENILLKKRVNQIIIAKENISNIEKSEIIDYLESYQIQIKSLNFIPKKFDKDINIDDIKELDITDVIGGKYEYKREIVLDKINNKTIMITGAGGSIGSELTKRIILAKPKKIILVDNCEYNLFQLSTDIRNLIISNKINVEVKSYLTSILNRKRIYEIFKNDKPNQVFHAAAYKHLELVEQNVIDGFNNNVIGSINVIDAAVETKSVSNFTLISTDKAVRPTSIMGKTKRISEIYLQIISKEKSDIKMSIVRFGNVFNSSGSVIPIFRKQISSGGPVTVRDKNITRYFMSIPEASELILEANDKAHGGEIFVLDMGEPVKILDIAEKMITLAGLKVKYNDSDEGDILIRFTGLKDGEKLHEELFIGENVKKTNNKKIHIATEPFTDRENFDRLMKLTKLAADDYNEKKLSSLLSNYI